jgi:hypothetical protein
VRVTDERLRASAEAGSAVEGEKLVTRRILEQTRRNSDDLAAIKARSNAHDARFDRLEAELRSLRRNLPGIIAETLRDVLREERR